MSTEKFKAPPGVKKHHPPKQVIRRLKQHDILFLENDVAGALYIIKQGTIRLFKPKKDGQIELATLHAGEVIGEMAYFDQASRRRSCSAEAMVTTELIEITFEAFDKVLTQMNPWFKTIIVTLVERLKKANVTIKKFEDSGSSLSYGETVGSYKFFKDEEVVKFLALFYLMGKGNEKEGEEEIPIPVKQINYFLENVFNFNESKKLEFVNLLEGLKIANVEMDDRGSLKDVKIEDMSLLKSSLESFNNDRYSSNETIKLTKNCMYLLEGILKKHQTVAYTVENPTVNIQTILNSLGKSNIQLLPEDYNDAIKHGLMEEPTLDAQKNHICRVDIKKIEEMIPLIRVNLALAELNKLKRK